MTCHPFACWRLAVGAALALLAVVSGPARAQVVSLTVGLSTPCPNGVAG